MSVARPYDYPGSPIVVDGGRISVELEHKSDAVEFTFEVADPWWADKDATRETYLTISRADWWAIVAYVAAEQERFDQREASA